MSHFDRKIHGLIGVKEKASSRIIGVIPINEKNFRRIWNLTRILGVLTSL